MVAATTLSKIKAMRSAGYNVESIAADLGVKASNGANMDAVIFRDAVVKWVRANFHANAGTDVAFYATVKAEDRVHFAACVQSDDMIIQERCIQLAAFGCEFSELTHVAQNAVMMMLMDQALRYGLFDLHEWNVGFRLTDSDIDVPVIFDYSGQKDLRAIYTLYGASRVVEYVGLPYHMCHDSRKIRANMMKMVKKFFG